MQQRKKTWGLMLLLILCGPGHAHESTDAILWMQTSAEYQVLVEQVFRQAKTRLPAALVAPPGLGALENQADAGTKPPAVIVDIDEAILNNNPWQAQAVIRGQREFDPDAWDDWILRYQADALPGAISYVQAARELGIEVFYVTNRTCGDGDDCPQQEATLRNLINLGFPDVDETKLLMKQERPSWTSEKSSRRAEIAERYRIIQLIGDDLGDFIPGAREADLQTRRAMAVRHREHFGHTWYLLPNPVYGSWKKALGASPVSHLEPDREQLCLGRGVAIGAIQGPGDRSHCQGLTVTTRGVVTLISTGSDGLGGFFIQDPEGDDNGITADGIFVVDKDNGSGVSKGDLIEIEAKVIERSGLTSLEPAAITVLARDRGIRPTPIRLPEAFDGELERYEGMLISLAQAMTITGNDGLADLGQIKLASADDRGRAGRLYHSHHLAVPGSPEAGRIQGQNVRRFLVLDDGRGSHPDPLPLLGEPDKNTTLRVGDGVENIVGVLDFGEITAHASSAQRLDYRIQPTQPPTMVLRNHRPAPPPTIAGALRIVNANVGNFFTTPGDGPCSGPCETSSPSPCRGAANETEFERQRTKLKAALLTLNADIIGFQGVENNGFADTSAIAGLTRLLGDDYAFIRIQNERVGCDVTSLGLVHRNTVRPVAKAHVLPGEPVAETAEDTSPTALAQVFEQVATGERFTVVVAQLPPPHPPDPDTGKGLAYADNRPVEVARQLLGWLEDLGAALVPARVIIGNFNAYAREEPLQVLEETGYVNPLKPAPGSYQAPAYNQVEAGLAGMRDHALVSRNVLPATNVSIWHINADEPSVMGYRLRSGETTWFFDTPFRAFEHDPVIVDITLDD